MFITSKRWHSRYGEQRAKGRFLAIMHPADLSEWGGSSADCPLRAYAGSAYLRQIGQFMMGRMKIGQHEVTLSGAYGNDGLPMTVTREIYDLGKPLPRDLQDAFWAGGGHNSVGTEAPAMHAWALVTFPARGPKT